MWIDIESQIIEPKLSSPRDSSTREKIFLKKQTKKKGKKGKNFGRIILIGSSRSNQNSNQSTSPLVYLFGFNQMKLE